MKNINFRSKNSIENKLPSNIEAEQALIGSILVNNDIIDEISNLLKAEKFFDPVHKKIFKVIETLNNISTSNLKPNLTFLLDLKLESSKERTFSRNNNEQIDKFEKKDSIFHKKVKDGFLEILKNNNDRIIKVDASKDINEISDFILKIVMEKINEAI